MTRRPLTLLLLLLAAALCGCGGGGDSTPPPTGLQLSYYYVLPAGTLPFTAAVGDRLQLLAYGTHATGQPTLMTSQVTWTSSAPSVASVSTAGVFLAKTPGATTITISYHALPPQSVEVTVASPGATPTATDYPFTTGSVWTYTGTAVTPSSVRPAEATTLTITVTRQVLIASQVWWEVRVQGTDASVPASNLWLRHQADGLLEYLDSSHQNWRLKTPLQVNATWSDPSDASHTWRIASLDEAVTVPANTYAHCLVAVEHWITAADADPANTPYDITTWYAPGVGVVRSMTTWIDPISHELQTDEQKLTHVQLQ